MKQSGILLIAGLVLTSVLWMYINNGTVQFRATETSPVNAQLEERPTGDAKETPALPGASIGEENMVEFRCAAGKGFVAVFARDIVGLTLSDGRQIELRQDASASTVRYYNTTRTILLTSEGDVVNLEESGGTTYRECRAAL